MYIVNNYLQFYLPPCEVDPHTLIQYHSVYCYTSIYLILSGELHRGYKINFLSQIIVLSKRPNG